jgi:hypothetical protein
MVRACLPNVVAVPSAGWRSTAASDAPWPDTPCPPNTHTHTRTRTHTHTHTRAHARSTHLGIVMEYVSGGNMADYILKTILLKFGSFDTRDGLVMEEPEARYFFTQVAAGHTGCVCVRTPGSACALQACVCVCVRVCVCVCVRARMRQCPTCVAQASRAAAHGVGVGGGIGASMPRPALTARSLRRVTGRRTNRSSTRWTSATGTRSRTGVLRRRAACGHAHLAAHAARGATGSAAQLPHTARASRTPSTHGHAWHVPCVCVCVCVCCHNRMCVCVCVLVPQGPQDGQHAAGRRHAAAHQAV